MSKATRLCQAQDHVQAVLGSQKAFSEQSSGRKREKSCWTRDAIFLRDSEGSVGFHQECPEPGGWMPRPARLLPEAVCLPERVCSCCRTGVPRRRDVPGDPALLHWLGCLEIDGLSCFSGGNWEFPSKR